MTQIPLKLDHPSIHGVSLGSTLSMLSQTSPVARASWATWTALHLFLPNLYRMQYKCSHTLASRDRNFRSYQNYMQIGDEWCRQAILLHDQWKILRNLFIATLGVVVPYMGVTKAPMHSLTSIFGSMSLFYSFTGVFIAHIYVGNSNDLQKPVVIDYWLKASWNPDYWFWTLLSLPAFWFTASSFSFLAFIFSSVWEDIPQGAPNQFLTLFHRVLLCSAASWASLHSVMIILTLYHVRKFSTLGL
ncbi:hypothetical protein P691DRAFT_773039 [Macrolepiota fuliginosa MF-IS2]|uniref:Uncharacterized protein n=1 Tax=Macrolepiota fuliginosa MF-IS2 TaxID=1400762 RepID=A0A9P6C4B6_9AGAR|nr:hypothetical protein P691DRAFT_773039 [Macrolepiota fuliginosa MF-IS2]